MGQYANPDVLVETDWLADHLEDPDVRVIEVDEDTEAYKKGHIPGAWAWNWATDLHAQAGRDYIEKDGLSKLLSEAGVGPETIVVLYGGSNNWFAAYAYWLLRYLGFDRVKLLNGGRKKWELEARELSDEIPHYEATDIWLVGDVRTELRAYRDEVLELVRLGRGSFVDVRSPEEYRGERLAPDYLPQEQSQVGGHIPGAANIPWARAANDDGTFRSADQLTALYGEAGITARSDVIAYCRIGERSSHTWFALHELCGFERVKNYDGSWIEYGSLVGVPVAIGSEVGGIAREQVSELIREPGATVAVEPGHEAEDRANLYRVWFATTRALVDPNDLAGTAGFANEPDAASVVRYGTCTVHVPRTHRFGSVGTAWWRRWIRLQFADDHLRVVERIVATPDRFFASLRQELLDLNDADRVVLVYLHGYNVSFDEAAIRAAQIGLDLKVPGATAFFSWPSCATAPGYVADTNRIAGSEAPIADFMAMVAAEVGATKVHVIAHSMGNQGLARAIQRITARAADAAGVRFGQLILAAPDIDVTLFKSLAAMYPGISDRTTMYVSAKDRALGLSSVLARGDRAGYTPPVTVVPQIDTIEVTNIDLTMLGHRYYAEAEAVLNDMDALMKTDSPPDRRIRLDAAESAAGRYWVIRR